MKDFDINSAVEEFGKLDRYFELDDSDQEEPSMEENIAEKKNGKD